MCDLKAKATAASIDAVLAQVRNQAAKSEDVSNQELFSALEHLADQATGCGHDDADYYKECVKECKDNVKKTGLKRLVMRLVGTAAAKKVAVSAG